MRSALGWITAIAVVISVASYALSLAVSAAVLTTTQLGSQLMAQAPVQLYLEAFLLIFSTPFQANVFPFVVVFLAIFAVSFLKAATANGGFLPSLRTLSSGTRPRTLPNWLVVMPLVGSALLVIDLLLSLLQDLFGVGTGALNTTDPTVLFPSLALAPVAEEFGFRITAMGIFTAVLVAVKIGRHTADGSKRTISEEVGIFFSAFLSPGFAKERVGLPSIRTAGVKGISTVEWVALAITSVVFGLYHILGGAGWGPGKFLTATLSGLVLGVVYLAYGAYADILLHWFFDLYLYAFSVYTALNGFFVAFSDLATLGALALGVWGIIVGIVWLTQRTAQPVTPAFFQIPGSV